MTPPTGAQRCSCGGALATAKDGETRVLLCLSCRKVVGVGVTAAAHPADVAMTGKAAYQAKGRLPAGTMNKTEAEYAALLEAQKRSGEIVDYRFEPVGLRIAANCVYHPDWLVIMADYTVEFRETKGGFGFTDDSLVKIKVAAFEFPYFRFRSFQKLPKKNGGGWKERVF